MDYSCILVYFLGAVNTAPAPACPRLLPLPSYLGRNVTRGTCPHSASSCPSGAHFFPLFLSQAQTLMNRDRGSLLGSVTQGQGKEPHGISPQIQRGVSTLPLFPALRSVGWQSESRLVPTCCSIYQPFLLSVFSLSLWCPHIARARPWELSKYTIWSLKNSE